jgi:hypothetical protein
MFMVAKLFRKINWDAVGIGASVICALHCIALPLFFSSLPLLGIELLENELLEGLIILISFLVGSFSLVQGYRKHNRAKVVLWLFVIGLLFVIISSYLEMGFWIESLFKFMGALGIVFAHYLNWKKMHAVGECTHNNLIKKNECYE